MLKGCLNAYKRLQSNSECGTLGKVLETKEGWWAKGIKNNYQIPKYKWGFSVTKSLLQNPFNTMNKPKHIFESLKSTESKHIRAHQSALSKDQ